MGVRGRTAASVATKFDKLAMHAGVLQATSDVVPGVERRVQVGKRERRVVPEFGEQLQHHPRLRPNVSKHLRQIENQRTLRGD